jgi:hypothetical protein
MSEKATKQQKSEFTIKEAAEYLGKSVRTVERMKLPHKLKRTTLEDFSYREVRMYDKSVLDQAKSPKTQETHVPGTSLTKQRQTDVVEMSQFVGRDDLMNFAEVLITGLKSEVKQLAAPMGEQAETKKPDLSQIAYKLLLSKKEALQLSGLSSKELDKALEKKLIVARKTSEKGIWKISRQSLESYCLSDNKNAEKV